MSDNYDFTTIGITCGTWEVSESGRYEGGNIVTSEYFVRVEEDDTAIASEIIDPKTSVPSLPNANLISVAPALLRYAMWEEEFDYINAQTNEGLSTADAQRKFHLLAWKYFPELKDTMPALDEYGDNSSEFWEAIGKHILKLRQDALSSLGLPALVDTDGEALIVREISGAA
jgi:hypothetical protein